MRGTSYEQDSRFPDKNKKMLNESVWPDEYDKKIDLTKVVLILQRLIMIWSKFGSIKKSNNYWERKMIL